MLSTPHQFDDKRSLKRRLYMLACESDPTATKVTMAVAAWLLGLGFWFGPACPYVACRYLEETMPAVSWGAIWTAYAALLSWRILDARHRPLIALLVNLYGAFLFGGIAVGTTIARWPQFELSASTIALALGALWVLARTAVNPGYGFRGD